MSDHSVISDIQIEHYAADRDKRRWFIVEEPDGTYTVKEFTIDGVAPPTSYQTPEQAVARLMQMARVRGPIYAQTWPERIQIGEVGESE